MGLFEDPYGKTFKNRKRHSPESVKLAKTIADESTVLLKNENTVTLVAGYHTTAGSGWWPRPSPASHDRPWR